MSRSDAPAKPEFPNGVLGGVQDAGLRVRFSSSYHLIKRSF